VLDRKEEAGVTIVNTQSIAESVFALYQDKRLLAPEFADLLKVELGIDVQDLSSELLKIEQGMREQMVDKKEEIEIAGSGCSGFCAQKKIS